MARGNPSCKTVRSRAACHQRISLTCHHAASWILEDLGIVSVSYAWIPQGRPADRGKVSSSANGLIQNAFHNIG